MKTRLPLHVRLTAPALAVALAVPLGCAAPRAADEGVAAERLLSPELLPTPFSADEIRAGNPPGTTRVYVVRRGADVALQRTTFLEHAGDQGGLARFEVSSRTLDGEPIGTPTEASSTWAELQAHASYPRAEATLASTICTTAAGRHEAWMYDWRQPARDGRPATHHRVWFAKSMPGPPVLYERIVADVLAYRMELVQAP
jgi:hypothetical protein